MVKDTKVHPFVFIFSLNGIWKLNLEDNSLDKVVTFKENELIVRFFKWISRFIALIISEDGYAY